MSWEAVAGAGFLLCLGLASPLVIEARRAHRARRTNRNLDIIRDGKPVKRGAGHVA